MQGRASPSWNMTSGSSWLWESSQNISRTVWEPVPALTQPWLLPLLPQGCRKCSLMQTSHQKSGVNVSGCSHPSGCKKRLWAHTGVEGIHNQPVFWVLTPKFPCRNPGSTKNKQRPDPTAQGQPRELGHGALGQRQLEQKQLKKLEQRQQEHLEQRQLEQKKLERRQQKKLEQKQKKKLEQKQQEKLEQKQHNHLEQRQQKKLKHLEQNHLEQKEQRHLEKQNYLEQRQPCSLAPRNCWLSPAPKKKHKELFPSQSPQPWLPQEPSPARKRRHRKRELKEQEMS